MRKTKNPCATTLFQFLFCFPEQLLVNIKTETLIGSGTRTAWVSILISRIRSCENLHALSGSVSLYLCNVKRVGNSYC